MSAGFAQAPEAPSWCVAYSGGLDSHCLLHLASQVVQRPQLRAVHINHQLSPQADAWAEHCRQQCQQLGIALEIIRVDCEAYAGASLEQRARKARYAAFEQHIQPGELLLTAHHQDDQAETLLLRLMRGTGIDGAAAMPALRVLGAGQLFRPLLAQPRAALLAYAQAQGLQWVEDESNTELWADRNYLRQQVLPLLEQRWPGAAAKLAGFTGLAAQSAEAQRRTAEQQLQALRAEDRGIDIEGLMALDEEARSACLREALRQAGVQAPSQAQLADFQRTLLHSREDAEPKVEYAGLSLRRFRKRLYLIEGLPEVDGQEAAAGNLRGWQWHLPALAGGSFDEFPQDQLPRLDLGPYGRLTARPCGDLRNGLGEGLCDDKGLAPGDYRLVLRQACGGAMLCQPLDRAHSLPLKKALQELAVPGWEREYLPILFTAGTGTGAGSGTRQGESADDVKALPAAIADYSCCVGASAAPGWQLTWHRPFSKH